MERCDGKNKTATHNKFASHLEFYHSSAIFSWLWVWASTCIHRFSIWFVAMHSFLMYTLHISVFSLLCPLCWESIVVFAHTPINKTRHTVCFAGWMQCCVHTSMQYYKNKNDRMHRKRNAMSYKTTLSSSELQFLSFTLHSFGRFILILQIHLSVCE